MQGRRSELSVAIDRIYGAVLEPAMWSEVLTDLADRSGGSSAMLLRADIVSGEGDVVLSRYNDPNAYAPYRDYYSSINPLHNVEDPAAYATGWAPTILRDEDWMAREAIEATEYYNDFLMPIDACYGLYLRLTLDGKLLTSISIGRGHGKGRFDDEAMAAVAPLHGDLIRAAGLGQRFAEVRRFAAGAAAAMDAATEPLLLLDAAGRIAHANHAGERLIEEGALLRAPAGQLAAASPNAGATLARALAGAAGPRRRSGSTIALVSVDGSRSARASVLPVARDTGVEAASGPAILVRVGPPADEERLAAAMGGYGLTKAERMLAFALIEGQTLRAAAAARGISINTARRQLAGLFDKTGVNRQIDLVRLLTVAH